jgi:hypothetical protein
MIVPSSQPTSAAFSSLWRDDAPMRATHRADGERVHVAHIMQQWRRVRDPTINVGLAIWVERQAFVCESSIPIVETLIRDNDAERLWVCWPVPVQIERVEGFRDGRRCKDATLQLRGAAKA